ncbi:MAG TPA: lysyl oxidase family protein [Terriglobales bacterium]|nr:lysyl oxidase family protein [Terriglobales bacterium]
MTKKWAWLSILSLVVSCGAQSITSFAGQSGALVRMDMTTTVGVLLDEFPRGEQREDAAEWALSQDHDFWVKRAMSQVNLTSYRLVFRQFYYPAPPVRGDLPLPAQAAWDVDLLGNPQRMQIGTHEYVAVKYHFLSYLVTDPASPSASEPALTSIGGTWDEPFQLPADPELVMQRSGYACIDEFGFPPNSAFEESVYYFYDQTCQVETPATSACHVTAFPTQSCTDALTQDIGMVQPNMRFTRVAYDPEVASEFRQGKTTNPTGPDLAADEQALRRENRIYYRYFTPDSCDVFYGTISQPGWRRLLTFSTNTSNDGVEPLYIGDLTNPANPWLTSNVFEFGNCDQEWDFNFYVDFAYSTAQNVKRAFCIEDTNRYHNDEQTPLNGTFQTCNFQGISAGWGDEYQFGISGQWVDITNVDTSQPHDLIYTMNPQQFLCEGQTLGANNQPVDPTDLPDLVFDPTSLTNDQGNPISRIRCKLAPNYAANDVGKISVSHGPGGFVNDACERGQAGPKRDCGFTPPGEVHRCNAGSTVTLQCKSGGAKQVVRVCETSEALGTGIACTYLNSAANAIIDAEGEKVSFACPAVKDATVTGVGGYSLEHASLLPSDRADTVHCEGF